MAHVRLFPMSSVVEGNDLSGLTLDDRYRLERRMGEGAMGQVYIGHDDTLDRRVAVKVLHPWLASEDKHRQRFLREARAATRIKHPNVVEMFDFGTTPNDSVYLVMELLHGRDLRTMLEQEGTLPWPRARHFLLQAVAALREAHRQDVIHRDIKPANCFVCDPARPGMPERMKLLDFGIAKLESDPGASSTGSRGKPLTQTGELVGTLAYMAPEFGEGRPASVHSDMYALGIMAYQLVTGDVPFTGRNEFQVLARHLNEPPVRPRVLVPELPEAAEVVLLTLLAKKPEHRFVCMADVEQALLAIPADATGPSGPVLVPRADSSSGHLVVRPRDSSGPRTLPAGRIRRRTPHMTPAEPPHGEGPVEASPPASSSGRVASPADSPQPRDQGASSPTNGSLAGGSADANQTPTSDVWELGEPFDLGEGPASPGSPDDDEALDELPGREWGTTVTVILLVLLSAAAVASVVMRQQGIELRWPWSDADSKTEARPAPNAEDAKPPSSIPDPASGSPASSPSKAKPSSSVPDSFSPPRR